MNTFFKFILQTATAIALTASTSLPGAASAPAGNSSLHNSSSSVSWLTMQPASINGSAGVGTLPTPPRPVAQIGSGEFAARSPECWDYLLLGALAFGANVFDLLDLDQAARSMRHYLGGTGQPVSIDPAQMLAEIPDVAREVQRQAAQFVAHITSTLSLGDAPRGFQADFGGRPWQGGYARRDDNADWYFAIGGFSYSFTALAELKTDRHAAPVAHITLQLHVYDRYDWDSGHGVRLAELYVPNEWIGRLNAAGLAREYEVFGSSEPITLDIPLVGPGPT